MKRVISLIMIVVIFCSMMVIGVTAQESSAVSGYVKFEDVQTSLITYYPVVKDINVLYMTPENIAKIGGYTVETRTEEESKIRDSINKMGVFIREKLDVSLDWMFKDGQCTYLTFSRGEASAYLFDILYCNGRAVTMEKAFEVSSLEYNGEVYLNLEQMLYLMHAQWSVGDGKLYYCPMGDNVFDFIAEEYQYIYDHSVQRSDLLMNGEGKWTHTTRIVLSHIFNNVDLRFMIPFVGEDMIFEEFYEAAILQLATADTSFADDYGSGQIASYMEGSDFKQISTNLSYINAGFSTVDEIEKAFDTTENTALKFSKWNNISELGEDQIEAVGNAWENVSTAANVAGGIMDLAELYVNYNEISTRSQQWSKDYVTGLELLMGINRAQYDDCAKYITKVAEKLYDEYQHPDAEARKQVARDFLGGAVEGLLDMTPVGKLKSLITFSNAIVKTNPRFATQIDNAELMNTVHALINVENVCLNEFVDAYHEYLSFVGIEDENIGLMKMTYLTTEKGIKRGEYEGLSEIRGYLEMVLRTSLKNKTFVHHFHHELDDDPNWENSDDAKELQEDIYRTYALLLQLINTRDYDALMYLDETYEDMYSDEYGLLRTEITTDVFVEDELPKNVYENLVTDAYKNIHVDNDIAIPKINLNSEDCQKINEEIWGEYYTKRVPNLGPYDGVLVSYEWSVTDDILSLVIETGSAQTYLKHYKTYNVNVIAEKEMKTDEILSVAGIDFSEYSKRAKEALGSLYHQTNDQHSENFYNQYFVEGYNNCLKRTLADDNINDTRPFFNKDGQLCVVAKMYTFAGAEYREYIINLEDYQSLPDYDKEAVLLTHEINISEDEAEKIAYEYWDYSPGKIAPETGFELFVVYDGLSEKNNGNHYYAYRLRWWVSEEAGWGNHMSTVDYLYINAETGECSPNL